MSGFMRSVWRRVVLLAAVAGFGALGGCGEGEAPAGSGSGPAAATAGHGTGPSDAKLRDLLHGRGMGAQRSRA